MEWREDRFLRELVKFGLRFDNFGHRDVVA
jgi:hypothetical protein